MKRTAWAVIGVSFAGSAAACVLAGASYPVAIWAVAFGVGYKALHREPAHTCPLLAIAAAQEEGNGRVVVQDTGKHRQAGRG
ncbi:hypothetical protein LLE49_07270 [Alicyclobacillus tolerans]|uniref:hypothetical protein n=1 Tax=Alicyclobacillus tolerans TaxID=90970 RepID=UPI001F20514D|nr:hypothetical protein [Alicyclobacillus tolerans]MCF8564544.1 hypothetical protein [Alicyclobacillus tolerans]